MVKEKTLRLLSVLFFIFVLVSCSDNDDPQDSGTFKVAQTELTFPASRSENIIYVESQPATAAHSDASWLRLENTVRNGGLGNGGTNFDAKTRHNSTDPEDIFIAHIAGMDTMARALLSAAEILERSPYRQMLADGYASFDSGKGKEFEAGTLSLEDVVAYAKTQPEPAQTSGKQELYETIVNMYV